MRGQESRRKLLGQTLHFLAWYDPTISDIARQAVGDDHDWGGARTQVMQLADDWGDDRCCGPTGIIATLASLRANPAPPIVRHQHDRAVGGDFRSLALALRCRCSSVSPSCDELEGLGYQVNWRRQVLPLLQQTFPHLPNLWAWPRSGACSQHLACTRAQVRIHRRKLRPVPRRVAVPGDRWP